MGTMFSTDAKKIGILKLTELEQNIVDGRMSV